MGLLFLVYGRGCLLSTVRLVHGCRYELISVACQSVHMLLYVNRNEAHLETLIQGVKRLLNIYQV